MRYSAMALAVASAVSFYSTNANAATDYDTQIVVGAGQTLTLSSGDLVIPASIGDDEGAITVEGAGSVVNANGATIEAHGNFVRGLVVRDGGTLNAVNTDISSDSSGIVAKEATINLTGGAISVSADDYVAGISAKLSALDIKGTQISSVGYGARGVEGVDSTMMLEDVNIFIDGVNGVGVNVDLGSNATIKNSVIKSGNSDGGMGIIMSGSELSVSSVELTTLSDFSNGILVNAGVVNIADSSVSTEGDSSDAIHLGGSFSPIVNANNLRVTTKGEDAVGLMFISGSSGEQRATLQNSSVSSAQSDGIFMYDTVGYVDLIGSTVTGGSGTVMTVQNNSTSTLVADSSTLNGDLVVFSDSTADVTLKNASVLNGAADNVTVLNMSNSQWNLSGDSSVGVFKGVNSTVVFNTPDAGVFKTLKLGSLAGDNTTFVLNTVLNEGGANAQSDKIHVTGDASGDHTLVINQAGGLGALTEGDGIQVVAIDGDATGSFKLGNRVSAGAYEYLLYQGGESDVDDWYLRSYLQTSEDPSAEGEGEGVVLYRPEVANYVAAPYLNEQYGFDAIGTRHERIGDDVSRSANGAWGRISGQHVENESGSFSYTTNTWFAQLGMDLYQAQNDADTKTTAGVMMTFGRQMTDAKDGVRSLMPDSSTSVGNVDSDMYSLGAYYSRDTQDGAYLDLVTQGTYYRNEYSSDHDAKQTGYGAVLSVEVGKAFPLGNGWSVEPQAQLMYQYLNLDAFHDDVSDVEGVSHSSARARGGLRIIKDMETVKPYVTMDVVHSLNDAPDVKVGSTKMSSGFTETWWRMGTGISVKVADKVSVYGDVKYQKDFSSDVDGYSGNVGVKVSF
ncbi:autotransporter [Leminorella grimontii]|uniref:Autotransporter n=5 Tax=Leminorella grimontii TaxID=82981 RepID=A0AAV5MVM5_9GAMM|nr:autotransporter [Leminorella grimontii]